MRSHRRLICINYREAKPFRLNEEMQRNRESVYCRRAISPLAENDVELGSVSGDLMSSPMHLVSCVRLIIQPHHSAREFAHVTAAFARSEIRDFLFLELKHTLSV
jgi:hypothetical protein